METDISRDAVPDDAVKVMTVAVQWVPEWVNGNEENPDVWFMTVRRPGKEEEVRTSVMRIQRMYSMEEYGDECPSGEWCLIDVENGCSDTEHDFRTQDVEDMKKRVEAAYFYGDYHLLISLDRLNEE